MTGDPEARLRRILAKYPEGLSTAEASALTGAGSKLRCKRTLLRMRDVMIDRWVDADTPVWMLAEIPEDCPRPDGSMLARSHGL